MTTFQFGTQGSAQGEESFRKAAWATNGPSKSKLDPLFFPEVKALLANGSTQKFIAKRNDTTPGNADPE